MPPPFPPEQTRWLTSASLPFQAVPPLSAGSPTTFLTVARAMVPNCSLVCFCLGSPTAASGLLVHAAAYSAAR